MFAPRRDLELWLQVEAEVSERQPGGGG